MKKTVYTAILLSIILTACVPEEAPYVPSADEEELPIEEQIKQIEEKAKEEARARMEAQKQEQQPEPPKEEPKPELKIVQEPVTMALGLYPQYFLDGTNFKSNFITVVGDEAPASYVVAISNLIARTPGNKPVDLSRLSSEIADISKYSAIVAGNPCNNEVISRMHGNPFPCEEAKLPDGKGRIRLAASSNGNYALVAEGRTDALVVDAVNFIGTPAFAGISGTEACVQGTTLLPC